VLKVVGDGGESSATGAASASLSLLDEIVRDGARQMWPRRCRPRSLLTSRPALTACRVGLAVADRDAEPEYEARLHQRYADACLELQHGQAENAEQAIGHYGATLEVVSKIGWPGLWARIHRMPGVAYYRRVRGDGDENLRQAYAYARLALVVYSREAYPAEWAGVHIDLGLIHAARADPAETLVHSPSKNAVTSAPDRSATASGSPGRA
jgi:hypothetical protein